MLNMIGLIAKVADRLYSDQEKMEGTTGTNRISSELANGQSNDFLSNFSLAALLKPPPEPWVSVEEIVLSCCQGLPEKGMPSCKLSCSMLSMIFLFS